LHALHKLFPSSHRFVSSAEIELQRSLLYLSVPQAVRLTRIIASQPLSVFAKQSATTFTQEYATEHVSLPYKAVCKAHPNGTPIELLAANSTSDQTTSLQLERCAIVHTAFHIQ
jgi:hypothetical protein